MTRLALSYKQSAVIVGIDEAGRGALAGPVVAGACLLPEGFRWKKLIKDSKQLTFDERERAFAWIEVNCIYGYGLSTAKEIDSMGILSATEKAMQDAIAMLAKKKTPTYLLVDGRDKFWFDYPHTSIIRGDETEACISAGSIVAKVTRDRMMIEYANRFPHYGFDQHKGYGVPEHIAAIHKHGPCTLHRRLYLRTILSAESEQQTTKEQLLLRK